MKNKIFILLLFLTVILIGAAFINPTVPKETTDPVTVPVAQEPGLTIETQVVSTSTASTTPSSMSTTTNSTNIQPDTEPTPEVTPVTTPTPGPITTISKPTTMAWIYPSEPGCNASVEFKDGRTIDVLKPEFFTVNGGALTLFDTSNSSCNGYSKNFVAELKRYSKEQYVTVSSASAADMEAFFVTALASPSDIKTLVDFVVENNLTGIELDFEDFGGWSKETYQDYLTFVERLGTSLHANNKKLMLDGPAIADKIEQGWFAWHYEDFVSLPVDRIVVMAYDYQFDHGTGEPVAPLEWIKKVTAWASAHYPKSRLTIGIPSYGYEGVISKRPYIRTYTQLKNKAGFANATRDESSGEMTWQTGNTVYFYQDSESLRQKIKAVAEAGIYSVSVWHLGGNLWFN